MQSLIQTQTRFAKLFNLKSICIFTLVIFFMSGNAYAQDPIRGTNEFIELSSHADKHLVGQNVAISGIYYDSNGQPIDGSIKLRYFYTPLNNELVFGDDRENLSAKNGMFFDTSFTPDKPGRYLIEAESQSKAFDSLHITVVDFTSTPQFVVVVMAVSALIILLTIVSSLRTGKGNVSLSVFRVARFTLVSIIVFGMISFFYFSDIEYGRGGTLGIVLYEFSEERKFDQPLDLNWVLHIGGVSQEQYRGGLIIPIYILIFGVFGGYLRFFYYTANKWLKREVLSQLTDKENELIFEGKPLLSTANEKYDLIESEAHGGRIHSILARVLTNRVMGDLSLLFIAPILAVMMYFVLSQSGLNETDHVWTFEIGRAHV